MSRGLCLELKKTTGELKDGMHSACAFFNTEGGWLIFGVAPKTLKVIGQEVTDKTQQEIAQALAGFEPAVDVRVAYVDVPECLLHLFCFTFWNTRNGNILPFFASRRKTKTPDFVWKSGVCCEFLQSGTTRNRTGDTRIFSPLLYQLSYGTIVVSCLRVQRYNIFWNYKHNA